MATALRFETDLREIWTAERAHAFAPLPHLTVSEWADRYREVPSYSAEPGHWVTGKTPYLREIMDSFNDPLVNKVVFMKPSRIGATEAGLNVIGYYIDQEPSPIFIVQPSVDDAKDFSKEQLGPTIEESERLRIRVRAATSRASGNTLQAKLFDGGGIYLVGANSPRGFRRRTARVIILEEVDGYPPSAGTEGDQVKLAERRATTYLHRRKVYLNSSPTVKGQSRIEAEFELSDQRRYFVPCPHCAELQHLRWAQLKYEGLEAPHYCCERCGALIPESDKFRMVQRGQWIATNPGVPTRGYHLNALYSPWLRWIDLVAEWREAQGDVGKLQVFVNTALGETWEDRGGGMDPDALFANRRESYRADVPAPVGLLTCGIDIQHDRIEAVTRGWGAGEESWFIDRSVWLCDPTNLEEWKVVDAHLAREWTREDGTKLRIAATCVDSGDLTQHVYQFCKPRYPRKVFATKGSSEPGRTFLPRRPSYNNKPRCPLFTIGVNAGKATIYARIRITGGSPFARAAGKYHWTLACDQDYFAQLTAERAVKRIHRGMWVTVYENPQRKRNEVLDCELLALAARGLSGLSLEQIAARAGIAPVAAEAQENPEIAPEEPKPEKATGLVQQALHRFRRPRGGWVNRF